LREKVPSKELVLKSGGKEKGEKEIVGEQLIKEGWYVAATEPKREGLKMCGLAEMEGEEQEKGVV